MRLILYSLFSFHILENDFNNIFFKYFNSIIIRDFLIFKGFKKINLNYDTLKQIKDLNIHLYYNTYHRSVILRFIDNFTSYISKHYNSFNSDIESHLDLLLSITYYDDFYFNIEGFKDPKIAQKIIDYKKLKDNLAHF